MKIDAYIKRKYPESYDKILPYMQHDNFKKYKIGMLLEDFKCVELYPKGTFFLFRKTKPVNDFSHMYMIIKNIDYNLTSSGFHSFNINYCKYEEIKK